MRCNYEYTLIHQLRQFCAIGKRGKYYCTRHFVPGIDIECEGWNGRFGKETNERPPVGQTNGEFSKVGDKETMQDKRYVFERGRSLEDVGDRRDRSSHSPLVWRKTIKVHSPMDREFLKVDKSGKGDREWLVVMPDFSCGQVIKRWN